MEQIILTAGSASELNNQIKNHIAEGWTPVGSHQVVERHRQNRYRGTMHIDTIVEREFSQTMKKD